MSELSLPVLNPEDERGREEIARELRQLIDGDVRFDRHDRMLYATDASIYQVEPIGVVLPKHAGDVEAVVRYATERRIAMLPRGGGTSLAGQAVNTAIVLDFSRYCDAVVEIEADARIARVQLGVVLDHLNGALARHGLMFGPDVATSSHATIGGMVGNNSAGAHSILYGLTVEHLDSLDILLADGSRMRLDEGAAERDARVAALTRRVAEIALRLENEIDARFPHTRRRVDGYNLDRILAQLRASTPESYDRVNLAHLICGAEGTLGIAVEASLRLVDAPRCKGLAIVGFDDVDHALAEVGSILATRPAAVELVDDVIIDLARRNRETRAYLTLLPRADDGKTGAVLYVEYFADNPDELDSGFGALRERFGEAQVRTFIDPDDMTAAWRLRKAGEPLLHGLPGARKPLAFVEDTAVVPDRLPEFIRRFRRIITAHGTTAAIYAHASVGCLHIRPLVNPKDPTDVRAMQSMGAEVAELVADYNGALSGEHGDGRVRSHLLEGFFGPELCAGFAEIKRIFDPDNLMNPGIIADPAPMAEQWRVRPADRVVNVPGVPTFYRYRSEHGFEEAVERCNGAGVCRRMTGGTMCPSFHATRDERHTTRGRGNALRLAITGQFSTDESQPAWRDPETLRTLDLCLSCKACKSECPSNVDMARLKAEYLAQGYREAKRAPFQARMFGRIRRLNRLGARVPTLANALARFGPVRTVMNRLLDLHPQRSLPPMSRSLYTWFRSRRTGSPSSDAPVVVLFPDCFTVYNEPRIGRAAVHVLEALGYRVVLPQLGCCGRAMISNGVLDEAIRTCRATARALIAAVDRHGAVAVVGCEPSCISAITDDWTDLDHGLDDALVDALAERSMLIEDFLQQRWDDHPNRPILDRSEGPRQILLHGHCHQKALGSTDPTLRLLQRLTTGHVNVIEAGCCGMAGAFGYTRDHFELSMAIAERSLLPSVREAPSATIAAPGTSCRHQIRDGSGREALHPIELVANALHLSDRVPVPDH